MLKRCFKCGKEKPIEDFYRHSQMDDGHLNKCKECTRKDVRENRKKKYDYYRGYDRKRGHHQSYEYTEEYRHKNPLKAKAHNTLNTAVYRGKIIKPKFCEECGSDFAIEAHHEDYSKPLDVVWLCSTCHAKRHHDEDMQRAAAV